MTKKVLQNSLYGLSFLFVVGISPAQSANPREGEALKVAEEKGSLGGKSNIEICYDNCRQHEGEISALCAKDSGHKRERCFFYLVQVVDKCLHACRMPKGTPETELENAP